MGIALSVIIPTYRRPRLLCEALEALNQQTYPASQYEVLVADDGSQDGTLSALQQQASLMRPRTVVLSCTHRGPAAARNQGIAAAQGEILLFLDDDVIATPTLLAEHMGIHEKSSEIAVLGMVEWFSTPPPTAFMRFLAPRGPLFHYHTIRDFRAASFKHFYALNISLERSWFTSIRFDEESFPFAALEDSELGYRLFQKGLRIVFHPKALAYHRHTYTPEEFWRRMETVGASASTLLRKHPELRWHYLPPGLLFAGRLMGWFTRFEQLAPFFGKNWWWAKTVVHYTNGIRLRKADPII